MRQNGELARIHKPGKSRRRNAARIAQQQIRSKRKTQAQARHEIVPKAVTHECSYRGSSSGLAWIPA